MVKFGYMRYSKTVQILRLAVHCFPGATTCLFPASSGVSGGQAALQLLFLCHPLNTRPQWLQLLH